jgi:PAS domain S-box-containing protein
VTAESDLARDGTKERGRGRRLHADLLDAAGQAIIATDVTGAVIFWNRAAQELYGWSSADAIGRDICELITVEETGGERASTLLRLEHGENWSCGYWANHRDGTRFPVYVTHSPVFGRDGQLVAVIGVSVDVTQRRAGEDARRQLAAIVEGSGDAIFGALTSEEYCRILGPDRHSGPY